VRATLITEAVADLQRSAGLFLGLTHRATGAFVGSVSLRLPALDMDPWSSPSLTCT